MSRRTWLIPIFAFAALAFFALEYEMISYTYDAYSGPYPSLFTAVCFLGLAVYELSESARKSIRHFPFMMCIVVAVAIAFVYLLTPHNPGHLWYWEYVPLYALIVVEVLLLWSAVSAQSYLETSLVGRKIKFSFLLLFLLTLLGGVNSMYGQMVSFFFMTVPVVLSWEEVIDRSRIINMSSSSCLKGPAIRTALALIISFIAGFVGVYLGNWFWVT